MYLAGISYVDHSAAGIFSQSHYDQAIDSRFGSVQRDLMNTRIIIITPITRLDT